MDLNKTTAPNTESWQALLGFDKTDAGRRQIPDYDRRWLADYLRRRKRSMYQREITRLCRFVIPEGARVLQLGCMAGLTLAAVKPSYGLGMDPDPQMVAAARDLHQDREELAFYQGNAETFDWGKFEGETFDYVILADVLAFVGDVERTLTRLRAVCGPHTRLVITFHSNVWRPIMSLANGLGLRRKDPNYNWLSARDLENLLALADYDPVTLFPRLLFPLRLPGVYGFMNRVLAKLPFFRIFCLLWCFVVRPMPLKPSPSQDEPSVSVLIPTRNEKGNVEGIFTRTPPMGPWTELVFVDGASDDGTVEEIARCMEKYRDRWNRVKLLAQTGQGKGQAVRQGFASCTGDVLMILDSDLTMPPEELPKYYSALRRGKGEFINGCRLVYPMEKRAMRFCNMIANYCFARLFTWLLGQPVKDTLCGTKVLWRKDYETIAAHREYFGDFDPFGDFDLLFGAAKQNRKIIDMPIRYKDRVYGEIKISRWRHGWLLLRMSVVAFRKLKLS